MTGFPNAPPFGGVRPHRPGGVQDLPVLHESPHYLVLNKPAGLASHPGPRTTESVEAHLIPHPRGGPWLVHRLDTDTSGCLLIARRKSALIAAQRAFAARRVRKTYLAIVQGRPAETSGTIDTPLSRVTTRTGWHMAADPKGDPATTRWRLLAHDETRDLTCLELELLTGRTHQARIHARLLGCPILGDPLYGAPGPRLHLLARRLSLVGTEPIDVTAPVPDDWAWRPPSETL